MPSNDFIDQPKPLKARPTKDANTYESAVNETRVDKMLRFEKYALFSVLVFSITVFVSEIDCLMNVDERPGNVSAINYSTAGFASVVLFTRNSSCLSQSDASLFDVER